MCDRGAQRTIEWDINGGQEGRRLMDSVLLGLIIIVIVALALYYLISGHRANQRLRRELDERFGRLPQQARQTFNRDSISRYWQLRQRHEQLEDCVDERTWDDLDMDRIFVRINSCLTSVGDKYLYALLHEPCFAAREAAAREAAAQEDTAREGTEQEGTAHRLAAREALMAFLEHDPAVRLEMQFLLTKMGRSDYSGLYLFNYEVAPMLLERPWLFNTLAALPLVFALCALASPPLGLLGVVLSAVANGVVHYRVERRLEFYLEAVSYLGSMLWCIGKLLRLLQNPNVPAEVRTGPLVQRLDEALTLFKGMQSILSGAARKTRLYTEGDSLVEFVRIIFLTQVRSYNRAARFLADNMPAFRRLYEGLGEVEAALAVLSLRMSLPCHTRPVFAEASEVEATGLYHPLLEQPRAYDVAITRNSLISGSNASGKSTFIKAVAINAILAQTINTCTATSFRTRPALVVTSMAARDNILAGESYFIAEIRSLKRLMEHAARRYCLCFIDEILKGTNTVERIAASVALLRQFAKLDSLCLVATHDIELTTLLAEQFENYHFEEQVTDEGVTFDYLLRSGPSRSRNAIKLLGTLGFDAAMIREAETLVEEREHTGHWPCPL
jgi:hypothetical protein